MEHMQVMAKHTHSTPAPTVRKTRAPAAVALPEMPPKTEAEQAINRKMLDEMRALTALLHKRNLDNAVLLAQMAAAGRLTALGESGLADHFAELGRRFYELLKRPTPRKRGFHVINGGAA